ncbi:cell division protein ZapB [Geoalkalibacter halelectricus]|uniref:Cell division protein ZapB n=1 Tax=Geoalkalibacter halelectricus TaxID=2847045 RepID=A0ABY5ZPA6_9BACT|nr:cell division protein ZapB [Geoalkalibacter halelectricus]MDO3379195.1 cell division protein ZapB [Geoalkalibacter halelectricus]UWZ80953.1 cell division protein ZapB [Geoalkalibacter halelectricus]
MNLNTLLQLEQQIDRLLERNQSLELECRKLREENENHLKERERFCQELDRILAKLGTPEPGNP